MQNLVEMLGFEANVAKYRVFFVENVSRKHVFRESVEAFS